MTNLNRQLLATRKTVGQYKVDVAEQRIHEINPDAVVHTYKTFYAPQTAEQFGFTRYDYVVDAIDTVTGKLELAEQAQKTGTPIISSMGAGNKMDAAAFEVTDIYKTSVCPLARVIRRELKKRGVRTLKVVYSKEPPMTPLDDMSISCRTHCICPPDRSKGLRSRYCQISRSFRASSTLFFISSAGTPRFCMPKATSSYTLSFAPESWLKGFWNTSPT